MAIRPEFSLSQDDIEAFRRKGYLKLKNIFSGEFIAYLNQCVEAQTEKPSDSYGKEFEKFKYDLLNDDPKVLALIQNPTFQDLMHTLTNKSLVFTQGIGFKLRKEVDKGFPWHVGTQSFGFQRREDYGCTIWIPLTPVNAKKQGGGMAYVPTNVMSGEFVYQHINCVPPYVEASMSEEQDGFDLFLKVKNDLLNSETMGPVLDHFAEQDDFNIGDAIVFNKYVIHRSVPLREGELEARLAFVIRFADVESRYDKERVEHLEFARKNFPYSASSDLNLRICEKGGDRIVDSPFLSPAEGRIIAGGRNRPDGGDRMGGDIKIT